MWHSYRNGAAGRRISELIAIKIRRDTDLRQTLAETITMDGRRSRLGSIALLASLLSGAGLVLSANSADAADCLAAPGASTAPNGHWYYHFDKATHAKCWYLGEAGRHAEHEAAGTAPSTPNDASSEPTATVQKKPSGNNPDALYEAFLQWKRRTNQ